MQSNINTRIYHGDITAVQLARALKAEFHRGNFIVQTFGKPSRIVLQITTQRNLRAGGHTALSVNLKDIDQGVMAQVDKQQWLGVAASLGATAIATALNPVSLLSRLGDIAQDIESIQMVDRVWAAIDTQARLAGASTQLSQALRRVACEYCGAAVSTGDPTCVACGAPLGLVQPKTCNTCGFVVKQNVSQCPNCRQAI